MIHLKNILRYGLIFVGAQFISTAVNVLAWNQFIDGVVYSEIFFSGWIDYLSPPSWISDSAVVVSKIDEDRNFKDPQQVLDGWNNDKLFEVWIIMLIFSVIVSSILTFWLGRAQRIREAQQDAP
jgi:hypothetical protein